MRSGETEGAPAGPRRPTCVGSTDGWPDAGGAASGERQRQRGPHRARCADQQHRRRRGRPRGSPYSAPLPADVEASTATKRCRSGMMWRSSRRTPPDHHEHRRRDGRRRRLRTHRGAMLVCRRLRSVTTSGRSSLPSVVTSAWCSCSTLRCRGAQFRQRWSNEMNSVRCSCR